MLAPYAGIVEPVRGGVEAGVRIGLGKQQQDDYYTSAENIQRKQLEVEIQATEDENRTKRREVGYTWVTWVLTLGHASRR